MATGRSYQPVGLPRRADGFQSKVDTSRDWKRVRRAENPLFVSTVELTPPAFMKEKTLTTKEMLAPPRELKLPRITQLRDTSEASHHKLTPPAFMKKKTLTTKETLAPPRELKLPRISQLRDTSEASHHKLTPPAFMKEKTLTTKEMLAPPRELKLPRITQLRDTSEASHHKLTPPAFMKEKTLTTKEMLAPPRELKLPRITQLRDTSEASHHKLTPPAFMKEKTLTTKETLAPPRELKLPRISQLRDTSEASHHKLTPPAFMKEKTLTTKETLAPPRELKLPRISQLRDTSEASHHKLTPPAFMKEKTLTTKEMLAPPRELKLPRITQLRDTSEASHHKLTPPAFMKEKSLTTEETLAPPQELKLPRITQLRDTSEASHHKFSAIKPFPTELVFKNFVPPEVYEKAMILTNNDKVPWLVKVTMEISPYFKLVNHNLVWQKVLPGRTATFRILFMPEQNKDYFHQLTCTTQKEKFIVPIRAIGPRSVLDFPANLDFSICPVNYSTQKTLLIRNVGNREARYRISTQSPFSVHPSIWNLGIGEATQVTVEFHPLETGNHSRSLVVHYDTGEDIHTKLYGSAVDVNIGLEKGSLTIEKTYLTMANRGSVVLHNRSEITAHFQWKAAVTREQEDQQKLRLCCRLQEQENEMDRFLKECTEDPTLQEHVPLFSRGFQKQWEKVQEDPMLFSNDIFTIDPVEGDVLPNSSIEINVIFKPQEARVYQQTIYCDISGREARLPLHIKAEGIGPWLRFSYQQLDIGKLFVGSDHSYEVFLFNKGIIDGAFSLIPPSTALGSCFTFHPQKGIIPPDGLEVIKISFSSTILGEFTEEFSFRVNGSPEPLTLTIGGCVIAPPVHFDVPSLDFGDVSFGFPHTLFCRLTNTSLVPMNFSLRIPGDGYQAPSVTSSTLMSDESRRMGAQENIRPTEFTINPCRGTIPCQGFLDIQVTLCSNTVKSYKLALMVDVEGVGRKVLSLLLTARCVVPLLRALNPVVTFGQCFVGVPYQQMLTLVNDSDLPGCYRILPQEYKEDAAVQYSSLVPCEIIQPHSSVEIPFMLKTRVMGEQDTVARLLTIGREGSPVEQEIHLVSIGRLFVYMYPSKMDFGSIQVLQDVSKTLYLSNQSPITASFWTEMAGKCSCWRIEPSKGVIPPNAELSVAVIANLDDTEILNDKVKVFIENSHSYVIPVQAVGIGTTIVIDKPIVPELNLGLHFSKIPFCYRFKVTNKGRQTHLLCWTAKRVSTFRQHRLHALSTTKVKKSSQNPKSACPVFKVQPLNMELMLGKSMEVVVEGFSSTPQVVKEWLLCHAVIGRKVEKVQIMQVDLVCEFIAPALQLSCTELIFRVEKQASDVLTLQYKSFSLKNTCLLPLSVFLAVEEPFSMCHADRQPLHADVEPVKLEAGEERHLSIRFNPAYEEGLTDREVEKVLKIHFLEHPHKEQVTVRGEVYFPNLRIQTTALDFGCILNGTEAVRYIEITNRSTIPVWYRWLFLSESPMGQMRSVIKVKVKLFSRFSPPGSQHFITPQLRQENIAQSERSASAESSPREEAAEEPAKGLGAAGDPLQKPADADDSLEAKPPQSSDPKMEGTEKTRSLPLRQFMEAKPVGIGIEDVFNILPRCGVVPPGKSRHVLFTFFGHANIVAHVMALCKVEGGLTYEVALSGEASFINYSLDITEIDYGLQVFNKVAEAEVTLRNSGKVGFTYAVLSPSVATAGCLQPRKPLVLPSTGYVGPGKEQALKVYYLPGVPGGFCGTFQVQVGYLEPEEISLKGEGDFPSVSLDLPRNIKGNEKYERVLKEAKEKMERDRRERHEAFVPGETVAAEPLTDGSSTMLEPWLLMEQMLLKEHALAQLKALASGRPEDTAIDQHAYCRLLKAELPEYILDFGYVILGSIQTHVVKITNTGRFPVSFCTDRSVLRSTGFSVEPDHMEDLPCSETKSFKVQFDPESASLPLGEVDVLLPIEVAEGPMFHVRLRANVTLPSLCLSTDRLDFSAVQIGQCQEETVQFHNQLQVPCEWFITISEPVRKVKKRVPGNTEEKLLQELNSKPHVFTALPLSGTLLPGRRCNVQVRFSPTEEKSYKSTLQINICQSSQSLQLQVSGCGLEPRLEFNPTVLELGPLTPCSWGVEGTVVVTNPCNFPIEFYSLEFDQEYLEEEQILRMLKDYDCQKTLLLPPRAPGEKLPPEVLQYYQDQKRLQGNLEGTLFPLGERRTSFVGLFPTKSSHSAIVLSTSFRKTQSEVFCKPECGEEKEKSVEERHGAAEQQQSTPVSKEDAGEQYDSPVYRALARHLGIDISAEGRAAQKRRGIVVIVHGAPLTGKTSAAIALSKYYGAACLSIDAVVTEAMSDKRSSAGLRARKLSMAATSEQSHKETNSSNQGADASFQRMVGVEAKHSLNVSQSISKGSLRPVRSQVQNFSSSHDIVPSRCTPVPQQLSIGGSTTGETGSVGRVLPEDLLVAILSERLKLSDCYQGVVFDGLETLFARSMASAFLCLLKAVSNRRHIYFLNLYQDYASWKAKEIAMKEQEVCDEGPEQEKAAQSEEAYLWDMDEEEYDALPDEQKIEFNNKIRQVQRERRKRREQLAQELKEKQQNLKKGNKLHKSSTGGKRGLGKDQDSALKGKSHPGVKQNTENPTSTVSNSTAPTSSQPDVSKGADKKGSEEHPGPVASDKEDNKQKKKISLTAACLTVVVAQSEREKNLALRFKAYEESQKDMAHILSYWDRVQGVLCHQGEGRHKHLSSHRYQKDREKARLEKAQRKEKHLQEGQLGNLEALQESKSSLLEEKGGEGSSRSQDVGVPSVNIQVLNSEDVTMKILESGKLPAPEQILDDLSLGPSGPSVPPTTFYSVVHYPEKREAPAAGEDLEHFIFVGPAGATAEGKTETAKFLDVSARLTVKKSEELASLTKHEVKEKAVDSQKAAKEKPRSGQGRKSQQKAPICSLKDRRRRVVVVPPRERPARLTHCRWIVPAQGKVELKVHFSSTEPGQFNQTLHFEILGTKRQYQLQCRGTCLYPAISQDPRLVFPRCRKSKRDGDIISKVYVMDEGVFHFGPLLCGKSKDWYKAQHCPGNWQKINILNVTSLEAEVHFYFEKERSVFVLDPPSMRLKPNEKQELSIWAYPTSTGLKEDNLICSVEGNPEPVVFRLCCQGVRVKLEVSPMKLSFGRLLLHRTDSKAMVLRNPTPLPVAWRISGLEDLGEDFSVSQDAGIIGPCSEFAVCLYFKATKVASIKTTFQLEVSDAENLLGTVQEQSILVFAKAYDIALDINLPEGRSDVNFGALNVLDEAKQVLTLKNKGQCDIWYSFKLDTTDTKIPDLASHFTIHPEKGMLAATERPMYVHLSFHPKRQMDIQNKPFLKCQVIDHSTSEGDEIVSVIPIGVSAKAAYSTYRISPASLINFGVMLKGTRKTSTFTLENKGIMPFQFHICDMTPKPSAQQLKHAHSSKREDKMTNAVFATRSKVLLKQDAGPDTAALINVGMFTVYPAFGSIPPGGQQTITVKCFAAMLGKCKGQLSIDIQGRAPTDNPHGIPYTLFAESCLPGFVVNDIESIFEEHRICSNMNLCQTLQTIEDKGVFITDEHRFIFTNAVVGRKATARFKIQNVNKIPCDVVLSIKPIGTQRKSYIQGIFKVDPLRMHVPGCSHAFATVTFTPLKAKTYQCMFEASLDVQASPAATKAQRLTFSISGAGNLPEVTVLRPALRDEKGNPLLLFKKLLLGDSEELPLVLHNSGIVPVQLIMDLLNGRGVFFLNTRSTTRCIYKATDMEEYTPGAGRKPHDVSLVLLPGESAEFDVLFKPTLAQHAEGKIRVLVLGSPDAEINIQLAGDGFEDEFILENIHGLVAGSKEYAEGSVTEDAIKAARVDHIQFGDCHVGTPYTNTFTVTNRSKVQAMRFEWLADAPFQFSPKVGHLHAGCTKDITVTLESDVPVTFKMHPVKCRVAKIAFQLPPEEVTDWDDCLCTVKEVDAARGLTAAQPSKKKVIEIDPEPAHTVLEESSHEVELCLSAVVGYAKFKLDREKIQFKETLQFQTRMFTFQLSNTGNVALEYNWMAAVQDEGARAEEQLPFRLGRFRFSTPRVSMKQVSKQLKQLTALKLISPSRRSSFGLISLSRRSSLNIDSGPSPFSVEPCSGTIPAGQEQLFQMKFSPVRVGYFKTRMLCSIPNLKPNEKGPEVVVKGRSLWADYVFELEDSDYITAKRRKSELEGPAGAVLDPNTRVIEFATSGVCNRHSRTFMVMNPTVSAYSFTWTCQDCGTPSGEMAFACLTEKGWIQPGEKAEMKFEFIPQHLDITESFWVFTIPELSISVPFLLVGNASDPLVILDRAHLNFYSVLTGREAQRTIYLINKEKETFSFAFRKSSLSSEGCNVKVEPLKGFISPLSRLPVTVFLKPTREGEVVLNLKCDVKRKSQPLSLNVKAIGFRKEVEKPRAAK